MNYDQITYLFTHIRFSKIEQLQSCFTSHDLAKRYLGVKMLGMQTTLLAHTDHLPFKMFSASENRIEWMVNQV